MCGIAGLVQFDGAPVPRAVLERMSAAIRHRGPDDHGIVCLPGDSGGAGRPTAGLASQRLSIVDVAGGHQPIANEDRSVWTVLNGEIYNFAVLRGELENAGHHFATGTDTEVIVHAYEQWGEAFVEHLDGMFAIALWDERSDLILLARDRFGKKPLVYSDDGTRLAFASELQALLCVPWLSREVDTSALATYLAYMAIPAPQTIYQQVKKLPPAHVLVRSRTGQKLRQYWSLEYLPKATLSEGEALEQVVHLLDAAVRKRLMGEVPLGAFLSGGVDSTAIVSVMASATARPVKTFSIGFDQPDYDELPHARKVAKIFGCDHHEFVVTPSAVDVLPSMVRHFGEPYADSSAIPTWHLSRLTRGSVTVALTGDGGDELFAGYGRHLANDLAERWQGVPSPLRRAAERLARARLLSEVGGNRLSRFAAAAAMSRADRYRGWAGVFSPDLIRECAGEAEREEPAARLFSRVAGLDAVDSMLAVDTRFYLPTDLLPKADIASMAHSLEVRSPFLDVPLAEFVSTLPSHFKLRRLTTKYLLKRAIEHVPAAIIKRPKRGFAVPLSAWFRGELKAFVLDHLQPSRVARAGFLRQAGIDRLLADHMAGTADYAHHLWVLLMLELWHRTFQPA